MHRFLFSPSLPFSLTHSKNHKEKQKAWSKISTKGREMTSHSRPRQLRHFFLIETPLADRRASSCRMKPLPFLYNVSTGISTKRNFRRTNTQLKLALLEYSPQKYHKSLIILAVPSLGEKNTGKIIQKKFLPTPQTHN